MMVYLASSGFVYIDMLQLPVKYFGPVFLTTVAGYIAGSAVSARVATRLDSTHVLFIGAVVVAVASLGMAVAGTVFNTSVAALAVPMMLYTAGMGLTLPHAMGLALQPYPHMAGTASALLGFIQMAVSAVAGGLTGLFLQDSPQPMLAGILLLGLAGLALAVLARRLHNRTPEDMPAH
jgi:DHA1 family bicyclomycin/chloramphenicol resistance-like MFS transporter